MMKLQRRVLLQVAGGAALTAALGARAQAAGTTFVMVQINEQALFFNQMMTGAQQAAKAAGVSLVVYNANNVPSAENDAIEAYIQQKVQGIVVDAIDVNGIMPAVQEAAAAHIPVVAVDSVLPTGPQLTQIGVDNTKAGKLLADVFLPYVKAHLGGKANIGIVGALNSFIQNQRQKGFMDAVMGTPGIAQVGVVDGRNVQDTALSVAETLLTGNPEMNVIYAAGAARRHRRGAEPGPPGQRQDLRLGSDGAGDPGDGCGLRDRGGAAGPERHGCCRGQCARGQNEGHGCAGGHTCARYHRHRSQCRALSLRLQMIRRPAVWGRR
jgi:ribose transport system substrate-binding protein